MRRYLSETELNDWQPLPPRPADADPRKPLRQALERADAFGPEQTAGRFWPVACVALEITQRCNLDCSLCYLSENAEAAHDVPLRILDDRIRDIRRQYGAGTSVQITGGDPTLRSVDDLAALCRTVRMQGMRSCLMTNGIKATRPLIQALARAGLDDIAFHVDMTQERKGYASEAELDDVRRLYLERARGLGLRVFFNTTLFDGNRHEIEGLAQFFKAHAHEITFASFQMQAATGRGVLGSRDSGLTLDAVMAELGQGFGTPLDFGTAAAGHHECNRYAALLVAGDRCVSALSNKKLFTALTRAMDRFKTENEPYLDLKRAGLALMWRRPDLPLRLGMELARVVWQLRHGLIRSRLRVHRLTVLVHNFMDASHLERDRCEACVFMVATASGPVSMCVHNAQRDRHVFAPTPIRTASGIRWWNAATGDVTLAPDAATPASLKPRQRKGRTRLQPMRSAKDPR